MQRNLLSWRGNIRRSHCRPTQQLLQYKQSPTMMWFKRLKSRGRKRALINTRQSERRRSRRERLPCLGLSHSTVLLNTDQIKTPPPSWPGSTSAWPALTTSSVQGGRRVKTSGGEKQHSILRQQTRWTSWGISRSARRFPIPRPGTSWW